MELRDQVREKLVQVTATVMGVDPVAITDDVAFVADLGAKSGNLTMIITELEDEFDIEIPVSRCEAGGHGWGNRGAGRGPLRGVRTA